MQEIKLKVSNVKCGGCVSNIQKGLGEMAGISSVDVDIPTGEVTLAAANPDMAGIKEKLRQLGYPPVE
ncbi:MAG: heavy-metal-associated domain-containing protein [Gammaproteobacteria bacterium]|nr:heavy-metal-associated domain-containing protein [Gammaproteobacteria bacterium]